MSTPLFEVILDDGSIPITLLNFEGTEELSSLFEFDLLVSIAVGDVSDFETEAVVGCDCIFRMSYGDSNITHKNFRGTLIETIAKSTDSTTEAFFNLKLVPYIALDKQTITSQIYTGTGTAASSESATGLSVIDILSDEIAQIKARYPSIDVNDLELDCTNDSIGSGGGYTSDILFACQYKESNFNFISRWMEKYGIFYYFDFSDSTNDSVDNPGCKMVFIDDDDYDDLSEIYTDSPALIPFDTTSSGNNFFKTITELNVVRRHCPDYVRLYQENPLNPVTPLTAIYPTNTTTATEDLRTGIEMRGNPVSTEDAELLTRVNFERFKINSVSWQGKSGLCLLSPGYAMNVEGVTEKLLITRVLHKGTTEAAMLQNETSNYVCYFSCVDAGEQYRPDLKTPVPVPGTETGTVYADATVADVADINEDGEYRVKFNFLNHLLDDQAGKTVSYWLRMIQPSAGMASFFMPLMPDVSVAIEFLGGDVDRPVIAGALYDQVNISPVDAQNNQVASLIAPSTLQILRHNSFSGTSVVQPSVPPSTTAAFDSYPVVIFKIQDPVETTPGTFRKVTLSGSSETLPAPGVTTDPNFYVATQDNEVNHIDDVLVGINNNVNIAIDRTGHLGQPSDSYGIIHGNTFDWHHGHKYDFGGYWDYNLGNSYSENHLKQYTAKLNDTYTNDLLAKGGPDWVNFNWSKISTSASVDSKSVTADNVKPFTGTDPFDISSVNVEKNIGLQSYEFSHNCFAISVADNVNTLDITHKTNDSRDIEMMFKNGQLRAWARNKNGESEERKWNSSGKLTAFSKTTFNSTAKTKTEKEESYDLEGKHKLSDSTTVLSAAGRTWDEKSYDNVTGSLMSHSMGATSGAGVAKFDFSYSNTASASFEFSSVAAFSFSASAKVDITVDLSATVEIGVATGGKLEMTASPVGVIKLTNSEFEYHGPGSRLDKEAEINAKLQGMIVKSALGVISSDKLELKDGAVTLKNKPLSVNSGFKFNC